MIQIDAVNAFSDNYIWLIYDDQTRMAAAVDPGDAKPVERALAEKGLQLEAILITHHHHDHVGGIDALLVGRESLPVFGPVNRGIPQITHSLASGDRFSVLGIEFSTLEVPGHTLDHIALFSTEAMADPVVFCGDTLFAGGCGRIFEGNPAMMHHSLSTLAALPQNTRVYCAHEYTLSNLNFARAVEPENNELLQRMAADRTLREQGTPTVPSTIALELATNPFLRCHLPSVKAAAECHAGQPCKDISSVFATVRSWKDNF